MPEFKKSGKEAKTGHWVSLRKGSSNSTVKASSSGKMLGRSSMSGRFTESVEVVSKKYKDGLTKLADR